MGYTHYFDNKQKASDEQWGQFTKDARAIVAAIQLEGVALDVTINDNFLDLNGLGDDSCEPLVITREGQSGFTFCKTWRRPYDRAVIAILASGERKLPGFSWSSDGGDESHCGHFFKWLAQTPENLSGMPPKPEGKTATTVPTKQHGLFGGP